MTQDVHIPAVVNDNTANVVALSPAVAEMIERAHSGVGEVIGWQELVDSETNLVRVYANWIKGLLAGESTDAMKYSRLIVAKTKYREHLIAEQSLPTAANDNTDRAAAA